MPTFEELEARMAARERREGRGKAGGKSEGNGKVKHESKPQSKAPNPPKAKSGFKPYPQVAPPPPAAKSPTKSSAKSPSKEPPKYRIEDFIIPASDADGDSIPFAFRMDKRWYGALQAIVANNAWKYTTVGQVGRHALLRHFEWLDSLEPGVITGTMADITMVREVVNEGQRIVEMADLIRHLEQIVGRLMTHQLRGTAAKVAYKIRKLARRFEDGNLRKYFLKELETKFGYLYKSSGQPLDLAATADPAEIDLSEIQLHETYDWKSGNGAGDNEHDEDSEEEDDR